DADMATVMGLREAVAKVLEPMRNGGAIGASLEAEVDLYLPEALLQRLALVADELRFVFITSYLRLHPASARPESAIKAEGLDGWIVAAASSHSKCVRCWHLREDVGTHRDAE